MYFEIQVVITDNSCNAFDFQTDQFLSSNVTLAFAILHKLY